MESLFKLKLLHYIEYRYADENEKLYIQRLKEWVAIKSVSGWPHTRQDTIDMVKYVAKVGANMQRFCKSQFPLNQSYHIMMYIVPPLTFFSIVKVAVFPMPTDTL